VDLTGPSEPAACRRIRPRKSTRKLRFTTTAGHNRRYQGAAAAVAAAGTHPAITTVPMVRRDGVGYLPRTRSPRQSQVETVFADQPDSTGRRCSQAADLDRELLDRREHDVRVLRKAARFDRTLLDEWAYQRPYTGNTERTDALTDFLHTYNRHRCHTALTGQPPISRMNNPAGQYV
jgi:hypothetical protein